VSTWLSGDRPRGAAAGADKDDDADLARLATSPSAAAAGADDDDVAASLARLATGSSSRGRFARDEGESGQVLDTDGAEAKSLGFGDRV
tara:strand:+ start:817 stop:1083 length:267 start_codon:yes stop_codon:yes gene_type:complete